MTANMPDGMSERDFHERTEGHLHHHPTNLDDLAAKVPEVANWQDASAHGCPQDFTDADVDIVFDLGDAALTAVAEEWAAEKAAREQAEAERGHYRVCRDIEVKLRDKAEAEVERLRNEPCGYHQAQFERAEKAEAEVARLGEVLPSSFYADRSLEERIRFMVDHWNRATKASAESQDRAERAEAEVEKLRWLAEHEVVQVVDDNGEEHDEVVEREPEDMAYLERRWQEQDHA